MAGAGAGAGVPSAAACADCFGKLGEVCLLLDEQDCVRRTAMANPLFTTACQLAAPPHPFPAALQYEGFMSAGQRHLRLGAGWRYMCRANNAAVGEPEGLQLVG